MSEMFMDTERFNQNLTNWQTSSLENVERMFKNTQSFNSDVNNFQLSKVTKLNSMFQGAASFNKPINKWDVSNVVTMDSMFENAKSFNQDLNSWGESICASYECPPSDLLFLTDAFFLISQFSILVHPLDSCSKGVNPSAETFLPG